MKRCFSVILALYVVLFLGVACRSVNYDTLPQQKYFSWRSKEMLHEYVEFMVDGVRYAEVRWEDIPYTKEDDMLFQKEASVRFYDDGQWEDQTVKYYKYTFIKDEKQEYVILIPQDTETWFESAAPFAFIGKSI